MTVHRDGLREVDTEEKVREICRQVLLEVSQIRLVESDALDLEAKNLEPRQSRKSFENRLLVVKSFSRVRLNGGVAGMQTTPRSLGSSGSGVRVSCGSV